MCQAAVDVLVAFAPGARRLPAVHPRLVVLGEGSSPGGNRRAGGPERLYERRKRAQPLTPCQQRLLTLLSTGLTSEQAARRLHVSPNTVKTHLQGLYRRLGVAGKTQAVIEGYRLGLVDRATAGPLEGAPPRSSPGALLPGRI